MAAGKWKLYEAAKERIGDGTIDLDGGTFKMALFTSSSNAGDLEQEDFADLTNEVATGNGYTASGVTLTNVTWTRNGGTVTFDTGDATWTASGGSITARYAVIYLADGQDDPLLCVCVLDTTPADVEATDGNPLTIEIAATGVFTLSGADSD